MQIRNARKLPSFRKDLWGDEGTVLRCVHTDRDRDDTEVPKMACIDLYGGVHTALTQQRHWILSNLSVSVSVSGSVSVP